MWLDVILVVLAVALGVLLLVLAFQGLRDGMAPPSEPAGDTGPPRVHDVRVADQESRAIQEILDRLQARYPDVPPETVGAAVQAAQAELAGHPIRDFVPVLVERGARERLRAAGPA